MGPQALERILMNQEINIKDLAQLLNAAVALHQSDQKTGAEEKYSEVLSYERDFQGVMQSDTPEAQQQSTLLRTIFSQAYNNLGVLREDERKFGQAIANFRNALDFAPGSIEAHTNLGRVFRKKGNYDSALGAIRGALDLKPDRKSVV